MYILDEPSIGLHQRDNDRLIYTLAGLRDLGNSVIVVEHDEDTIGPRITSWISVPEPASAVAKSSPRPPKTLEDPDSLTAQYLSGAWQIPIPGRTPPREPEPPLTDPRRG